MNTDGCPPGFFTDEILHVDPDGSRLSICEGSVGLWLGFAIPTIILRWLVLIPQTISARKRWKSKQATKPFSPSTARRFGSKRISFFLISQLTAVSFQTLLIILASLNIANVRNGASLFLFGLSSVAVAAGHGLMARSVLKLGKKIIPLSEKKMLKNNSNFQNLSNLDATLKMMIILGILSVAFAGVFFTIPLGVADKRWTFQAGFFTIAAYQIFVGVSLVYQFERCLLAIFRVTGESASSDTNPTQVTNVSTPSSPQPSARRLKQTGDGKSLQRAIMVMRLQQALTGVFATIMLALSILIATFAFPLVYWAYLVIFVLLDIVLTGCLVFANVIVKWSGRKKDSSQLNSNHQQNAVVVQHDGTVADGAGLTTTKNVSSSHTT